MEIDFPGEIAEARLEGRNWVVFFSNVPWPSIFPVNRFHVKGDRDCLFRALWWERHQALLEPSETLTELLQCLDTHGYYTSQEVLTAFASAGYTFGDGDSDQIDERVQLMPRINGWFSHSISGSLWKTGRSHLGTAVSPAAVCSTQISSTDHTTFSTWEARSFVETAGGHRQAHQYPE